MYREEAIAEGKQELLMKQVQKKLAKNQSVSQIAEALEETEETIQAIIKELQNV